MDASLKYQGLIAACGMNCDLCIGYLREKKPCGGCFKIDDPHKPTGCRSCKIVNCEYPASRDFEEVQEYSGIRIGGVCHHRLSRAIKNTNTLLAGTHYSVTTIGMAMTQKWSLIGSEV